ncbi:MAG: hypothetical protein ACYSWO_08960 [Planctomycetota bacterium]|jgi:hypothetical protein
MNKHKKRSTFGLRIDQLADLFGVAADDHIPRDSHRADEQLAETLRRRLTEVMPGNSLLLTAVSKIAPSDVTAMAGKSLLQALSCPGSSAGQLQVLKEASKSLSTAAISEQERSVANTIYHAAIASCLVHHDKKISQHSYDKLDESFGLLIEKQWMAWELSELFSKARRICQTMRSDK